MSSSLDSRQRAAAEQFGRQSERYGRTHILADTSDVADALAGVIAPQGGSVLDVATGAGHAALWLARNGWQVTAGDIAPRILEAAERLFAEEGVPVATAIFPAEELPFADAAFDLVSSRVAPHHFSSLAGFVSEAARVLKPDGWFLVIDGSAPDDDPETEAWLHEVEKLRDPSHGRLLSRAAWQALVQAAGLDIVKSVLEPLKQPDLEWYFETAATPAENREKVRASVRQASAHVRQTLRLGEEDGRTIWYWPRITLLARKP